MFKKILCPSDLREESLVAIRAAVELARLFDAKIVLLNVKPEFMEKEEMIMLRISAYGFRRDEQNTAVAAKKMLEAELKSAGGDLIPHEVILREGNPHEEIVEAATEFGCDLIVMASSGRHHLLEHIKGSTAERVVAGAQIPVLVLPVRK